MSQYGSDLDRGYKGTHSTGPELDRKYWIALGLYLVLGLLVWFTMGDEKVFVHGKWIDLRLVPLIVIGGLALRTLLARQADRIRRQDGNGSL